MHAGDIPAFARTAEGELAATSYYDRLLASESPQEIRRIDG